jgi:NAD(P) transhydrogenase subunit beta
LADFILNIAYLISAVLFILGLKQLSHPGTAVRGNFMGALGMFVAVIATVIARGILDFELILAAFVVGAALGAVLAYKVKMAAMPQLVALFNGFGGAASVLVAGVTIIGIPPGSFSLAKQSLVAGSASGIIGSVTFWGSLVAFGKLQGVIYKKPFLLKGRHALNLLLLMGTLLLAAGMVYNSEMVHLYWIIVAVSSVLGISLVMAIGGADMPVVIALLNAYSGLAACATGFVLNNNILIIAGSLVGASGIILTNLMCKAMNRSFINVLLGGFGAASEKKEEEDIYGGKVKSTSPEEVAMLISDAGKVVIIPGYGMAQARAQHAVRDFTNLLESQDIEVSFAIHPVAGRMPGHMNVLLAEVDIPYKKLKELEEINPRMAETDVAIVLGANDVVNPKARTDADSPIGGMPIVEADKAKVVVVIKRSLSPGFSGIPNPLFAADNTLMLFGDAEEMMRKLISAVKKSG